MNKIITIIILGLCVGCLSPVENTTEQDAGTEEETPDAGNLPEQPDINLEVATLAGFSDSGYQNGSRGEALFNNPVNVKVVGDKVLVTDFYNHALRSIDNNGVVATLVDQDSNNNFTFQRPFGIAEASDGSVFIQTDDNDLGEHSTETGTIWQYRPSEGNIFLVGRNVGRPRGLNVINDTELLFVDYMHHVVCVYNTVSDTLYILAGEFDNPGTLNLFNQPYDSILLNNGNYLVSDHGNHCLKEVSLTGDVSVFAGSCGNSGLNNGLKEESLFNYPQALSFDKYNNIIYVTDLGNNVIRMIDLNTNEVSTLAGNGVQGYKDGSKEESSFFGLEGMDYHDGYLYITDGNRGTDERFNRVRRMKVN